MASCQIIICLLGILLPCLCVYGQDADSNVVIKDDISYQDIVISAQFKPSIRSASKIGFSPDVSSSIDSLPQQQYSYNLQFDPGSVKHATPSASINAIGFDSSKSEEKKTQYFKLGAGVHGNIDGAFHIDALPKTKKGDIHLLGEYKQLKPTNRLYRKDYGVRLGTLGRLNIKDKYEASLQYALDFERVRSNFFDESVSPSSVLIPSSFQELIIEFNNKYALYNAKFLFSPRIGFTTFNNTFSNLAYKQSETTFFVSLPMSFSLNSNTKVNVQGGYEGFVFKTDKEQEEDGFSVNNFIARGSANFQYFKDNINAYLGATIYGSSKYGISVYPEVFAHFGLGKASAFFIDAHFTTKQYYQSMREFRKLNPWIQSDSAFGNILNIHSQVSVQYNVKKRFNLRLSLVWNQLRDIRLITNKWSNNYNFFELLTESQINEIVLRNDYMYIEPDTYELGLTLTKTFIVSQASYQKPIGRLYPLVEAYGVWHVFNRLKLRASFMAYDKVFYLDANELIQETPMGIYDLGLYAEYAMLKKKQLRLWVDVANIFARPFERWSGYQHPGIIATFGFSFYL